MVDAAGRLIVIPVAGGVPFDVNLIQVLGIALSAANPVIVGVFDAAGNRMPSMDVAARPGFVDMIDRAARLVGIVSGEAAQLQQLTPADGFANPANALEVGNFPMIWDPVAGDWNRWIQSATQGIPQVQDTGVNTNPERWLQDNHWSMAAEVTIAVAGAPGEQPLGAAVGAGVVRRVREVTIRHAGTNNTVVSILDVTAGNILVTIDVPAQSTRVWNSQDGRDIAATLQPVVQTSDVTGGSTFVTASGVEA